MPKGIRDCILIPVPKNHEDNYCSENYRPIALASTLSKVVVFLCAASVKLLSKHTVSSAKHMDLSP